MIAYEVSATVHDGALPVSPALEGRRVRAILLVEDEEVECKQTHRPLPSAIRLPGFIPLTRDEIYDRP